MADKLVAIISSTVRDLTKYREHVVDACLRVGVFPKMMDHLPAVDADAISVSLELVDDADVYIGVFAHCEFPKLCRRSSLNSGAIQDH
jgi:hypothetical protein